LLPLFFVIPYYSRGAKAPRLPETFEHPNPGAFLLLIDFLIYFLALSLTGCYVVGFLRLFVWEYAARRPRWQLLKVLTAMKYDMR
jgi:hypothetical protein